MKRNNYSVNPAHKLLTWLPEIDFALLGHGFLPRGRDVDTNVPNYISPTDIFAVSTLSVNVPAPVSLWMLLDEGQVQTHELLKQIPTDVLHRASWI